MEKAEGARKRGRSFRLIIKLFVNVSLASAAVFVVLNKRLQPHHSDFDTIAPGQATYSITSWQNVQYRVAHPGNLLNSW